MARNVRAILEYDHESGEWIEKEVDHSLDDKPRKPIMNYSAASPALFFIWAFLLFVGYIGSFVIGVLSQASSDVLSYIQNFIP